MKHRTECLIMGLAFLALMAATVIMALAMAGAFS